MAPQYDWTFIYYGSADNNLETALMLDVEEMLRAGFGGRVALYGMIDRSELDNSAVDGSMPDGDLAQLGTFTTAKAFEVRDGDLRELAELGEIDMGHPDTLGWFVNQVMKVAPAERTGLILSDHGFGALSFGVDEGASEPSDLDGRELIRGLQSGLQGRRLDLIAVDACLSNNLDMARFMAPVTDRLLASEDIIPGWGFDYSSLESVVADPTMDADEVASVIMDAYQLQYGSLEPTTTLALTDLSRLGTLDAAMSSLADALRSTGARAEYGAAVAESISLISLLPGDRSDHTWFADLGDVARRLAQPGHPDSVRLAADSVFAALGNIVVRQYRGTARADATGMSLTNVDVDGLEAFHDLLSPGWSAWLTEFLGAAGTLPMSPSAVFTTTEASLDVQVDGVVVSADLRPDVMTSGAVMSVSGVFGTPAAAGGIDVQVVVPAVMNSGQVGRVAASWDFRRFVLSADGVTDMPTVSYELTSDRIVATISGRRVAADGGSAPMALRFWVDPTTGEPSEPTIWLQAQSGAWGQGAVLAGDVFIPANMLVPADGVGTRSIDGAALSLDRGLGIRADTLDGRDFAAGVVVRDTAGDMATVFSSGRRLS